MSDSAVNSPLEIALADGAHAVIDEAGWLRWTRPGESPVAHEFSREARLGDAAVARASRSGDSMLLAFRRSQSGVHLRASTGRIVRFAIGERMAQAWQLEIVPIAVDDFLVLFEAGFFRVDGDGREQWRVERMTFDWHFVGEREHVVWLSDLHGNLLGFDAQTGFERDG